MRTYEERLEKLHNEGGVEIMKASAGSGKTYSLTREYIRILLKGGREEKDYHRHILAVTFTNKATDNMKTSILEALNLIADSPRECKYMDYLLKECSFASPEELQKAARTALDGILNDYSSFSVSTIDRFFQRTLKSFAREIGQNAEYRVELDRESIVKQTVDSVLDSLTKEDTNLLKWLSDSSIERLEAGDGYQLENSLGNFAKSYFSSQYDKKRKEHGVDEQKAFSAGNLLKLSQICKKIRTSYVQGLRSAGEELLKALETYIAAGFVNSRILNAVREFSTFEKGEPGKFNSTWNGACQEPSKVFTAKLKVKPGQAELDSIRELMLKVDAYNTCGQKFREYKTATMLHSQVYVFRTADALKEHYLGILKEQNILGLDDTNEILRDLINGTDAPFIYEKTGTRFRHFLLDEFQDTALIQWECLKPLLANSIAEGCYNLIVGDVKQSIYRWRNADWDIFGEKVEAEMPRSLITNLGTNFRSARNVVEFNNAFFRRFETDPVLGGIYSKAEQESAEVTQRKLGVPGCVNVSFSSEDGTPEILDAVTDAHDRQFRYSDIAVIVRSHSDGAKVADILTSNGIPVVTDDSLKVVSSQCVRRVIKWMSAIDNPSDKIGSFGAGEIDLDKMRTSRSILDMADMMLRQIPEDEVNHEALYVLAFMDQIRDFMANGGNSLHAFLDYWKESGMDRKLASPKEQDAVNIITVHKSKGLEYPYAIVLLTTQSMSRGNDSIWDFPDMEGTMFGDCEPALYHVKVSEDSCFSKGYAAESTAMVVDYTNIWYVAFTRAKEELKIVAPSGSEKNTICTQLKEFIDTEESGFVEDHGRYISGSPCNKGPYMGSDSGMKDFRIGYSNGNPPENVDRIRISTDAADFFSDSPAVSPRKRGIILHGILENINNARDLPDAIEAAVCQGDLPHWMRNEAEGILSEALSSVAGRGWFDLQTASIQAEREILSAGEGAYRPDRVVIRDGSVEIIDYKFGAPLNVHKSQVRRYMRLYREMGYASVKGYLWYVEDGNVVDL